MVYIEMYNLGDICVGDKAGIGVLITARLVVVDNILLLTIFNIICCQHTSGSHQAVCEDTQNLNGTESKTFF